MTETLFKAGPMAGSYTVQFIGIIWITYYNTILSQHAPQLIAIWPLLLTAQLFCLTYSWLIHCGKDILIFTYFYAEALYKPGMENLQLTVNRRLLLAQSTTPISVWKTRRFLPRAVYNSNQCMENPEVAALAVYNSNPDLHRSPRFRSSKGFYNLVL